MKLFSSSRKKKEHAHEDTILESRLSPPSGPASYPDPPSSHPGPGPFGLGMPSQLASHASPSPGWTAGREGPIPSGGPSLASAYPLSHCSHPPNIVINQHYYVAAAPLSYAPERPSEKKAAAGGTSGVTKLNLGSVVNLATDLLPMNVPHFFDDGLPSWHASGSTFLNQGAALYDQLSSKFNNVLTLIDCDRYPGNEGDFSSQAPSPSSQPPAASPAEQATSAHGPANKPRRDYPKGQTTGVVTSLISGNYFAKVELYANSRLPLRLPPMKLYIDTYPLLSLAAKYSDSVYQQPQGAERFSHIDADWRAGTKAMVIKSVPMDYADTIVFAIRGTANFMDWAVNLNMAPMSPVGFLDDLGNFCHAGFLSAARKMIRPVAARLRQLLEEDPRRASYSLLITGHSAGGAVASLLYSHMLAASEQAQSELNLLTGFFRRVHCITFGTPPVSLLPLTKPDRKELKNSLFLSFVNEGDPVVRADKAYVKSLIALFSSAPPSATASSSTHPRSSSNVPRKEASKSSLQSHKSAKSSKSHHGKGKTAHSQSRDHSHGHSPPKPVWHVPPAVLSNAGRLIVLRSGDPEARFTSKKTIEERLDEGVVAQVTTDEQLRSVVWGDPVCHVMKLYAGRIETLAVGAVIASD